MYYGCPGCVFEVAGNWAVARASERFFLAVQLGGILYWVGSKISISSEVRLEGMVASNLLIGSMQVYGY